MHIDTGQLQESLERLKLAPRESTLVDVLERIITAVDALFDYDGAGVMFVRGGGSGLLLGMAREMCGLS